MSDPTPPKIEFPCEDYPIKIMGDAGEDFRAHVTKVLLEHVADFDSEKTKIRPSSSGKFESITVRITATGEDQLSTIFEALKKHPSLRMVL